MTELYLYQIIHLYNRLPRRLAAHVEVLDQAARSCFGLDYAPNQTELADRIAALAVQEGFPDKLSGFVRLELLPDGTDRLASAGISLYAGYALRSIAPEAITIPYELPSEDPTSAREAAALLARQLAERQGAAVAVRCDHTGICFSADDAPLFAVRGRTVYTSPAGRSVERDLGTEAVRAAGLKVVEAPIERAALSSFDELFCVDHRGVTTLSACDGHLGMNLITTRIAAQLEQLFHKG